MSLLSFRPISFRHSCTKTILACYLSQKATRGSNAHVSSLQADRRSFEAAGVRPSVATWLGVAFPSVQEPSAMQRKLIRAISQNRNVLLQDDTGTGKSFAAMLALLSKLPTRKTSSAQAPTSLLLVPHRDLAYQYLYWMHHMTLPEGDAPSSLTKYAQVLLRHVNKETLEDLPIRMQEAVRSASSDQDQLALNPPHVLIATPNAVLELMERWPEAVWLAAPSMVVVDEVDALLRVPSSKLPKGRRKKLEKHVPDLVRILDRLYPTSKEKFSRSAVEEMPNGGRTSPAYRPQLVMISATLRHRLQSALFSRFGWVRRGEMLRLLRKRSSALPAHRLARSAVHHVLVVSKTGDIKNIDGARPSQLDVKDEQIAEQSADGDVTFYDDVDDAELVDEADKELVHVPLAMDPAMLEAVAAMMALEVPRAALLVLPATGAVRKIVFELRQLGVDAHPLNLVESEASRSRVVGEMETESKENPVLIVGTLATIRGIDLAGLTHVFLVGVEGLSGDEYLHVAGRVGRFGGRGRVVSVVSEGEAGGMRQVLSRLGIWAARVEHFE